MTALEGQTDSVEEIKAILEKLQEDASDEVKRLIKAYNPVAKHNKNLRLLQKCSDSFLQAAATFLGGKPVDASGKSKYKSRDTLIDWLIMAIEGYFRQYCVACDSSYTIERGGALQFRCAYCWGGSHNCDQITSQPISKIRGFVWICWECTKKNELETFTVGDEEDPLLSAASRAALHRKFSFQEVEEEKKSDKAGEDDEDGEKVGENKVKKKKIEATGTGSRR